MRRPLLGDWRTTIPREKLLELSAAAQHYSRSPLSFVIAEATIALAGILLFRRGRWKLQRI